MYEILLQKALDARNKSYCPYSGFAVGAALLSKDGQIFKGCNIENASYSVTNCAERTALFKAVSEGVKEFEAIAIVGGKAGQNADETCAPCGVCRQALMEFVDPDTFKIVLGSTPENISIYTLKDLLPLGFGPSNLK